MHNLAVKLKELGPRVRSSVGDIESEHVEVVWSCSIMATGQLLSGAGSGFGSGLKYLGNDPEKGKINLGRRSDSCRCSSTAELRSTRYPIS